MATAGNLNILGDTEESTSETFKFVGEEAEQILFFFNKEVNDCNASGTVKIILNDKPPELTFIPNHASRSHMVDLKKKWYKRLHELECYVLPKLSINDVRAILKKAKLRNKLLPLVSKKDVVTIYALTDDDITRLKKEIVGEGTLNEGRGKEENRPSLSDYCDESISVPSDTILAFDTEEGLRVKVYKEAITKVKVEAIVNAANDTLSNYGGVALVISRAAGEEMEKECKKHTKWGRKIEDGGNIVTKAGKLPFKYIIHAVGPRWSRYGKKEHCLHTLKETVVNILKTAIDLGVKTVAMPAISSGIFGVPKKLCAAMYISAIIHFSMNEKSLGTLEEFHIIDINEELLYMVKEWYEKWKINHTCLKISSLLMKMNDPANQWTQQAKLRYPYPEQTNTHTNKGHGNMTANVKHDQLKACSLKERNKKTSFSESAKRIFGTDVHFYTNSILDLKDVDAVVVSEDQFFKGEGALAKTLVDNADDIYRKAHKKLQKDASNYKHNSNIVLTTAGKKLPFRHVFHVVINRMPSTGNSFYYLQTLRGTIDAILYNADSLVKKEKATTMSLALPMIGAGNLTDIGSIESYCNSVAKAVLHYLSRHSRFTKIRHIYLVNNDERFVRLLRLEFDKEQSTNQGPNNNPRDSDELIRGLELLETWRKDKSTNKDIDFEKYFITVGSSRGGNRGSGNLKIFGDDDDEDDNLDDCTICLCEMTCPVRLKDCHHAFCKECITEFFKQKPSCPVCGAVYGKIYGDQPEDGDAKVYLDPSSLPGYEGKPAYLIIYDFPSGKQGSDHPDPGTPYKGMKRKAYLPRSEEGTHILRLLKRAFEQGMTFTVGSSRTSGKEGVITWNDIHHKTSKTGGPQKFGYPDPEYLERVKEELACKGIL